MEKKQVKKEPEIVTTAMVEEWQEAMIARKAWEKNELELRNKICDLLTPDVHSGTHKFEMFGLEIKIERKTNIKIVNDDYEDVKDAFNEDEKMCVRLKPEVNFKEYKALLKKAEDEENEVDIERLLTCIKETPATPTLTIE